MNYQNIIAITVDEMDKDDDEYDPNEAYVLIAHDTTNSMFSLGYYPTYESACEAVKELADWLSHEAFALHKVGEE